MVAPRNSQTGSPASGQNPSSHGGASGSHSSDPNADAKRVLIVDDEPTFRLVARASLEAAGFQVEEAENGRLGIAVFQETRPDLVILDIRMPEMDGYETCAALRRLPEGRETPIVMLTGLHDPDSIEKAYAAGATDFLSKPVNHAILNHRLRQILRASRFAADFDELTGLPNRALARNHVRQAVASGRRSGQSVAVLYLDLDGFGALNETRGQPAGDEILRQVADRLGRLRSTDYVARYCDAAPSPTPSGFQPSSKLGGDEFIVVLPEVRNVEDCAIVAQRIGENLARPFRMGNDELHVTASIGISAYPLDGEEPLALLTRAELAMKHARDKGGARYEFFTESVNTETQRRTSIEAQLRGILERNELQVHYQARVDIQNNRLAGVEALARWPESLEDVWPDEFIPVAEQTGLVATLGDAVLRTACAEMTEMLRRGLPALGLSINLSAAQLQQQGIASQLARIVAEAHLDTAHVEIEVTENALLEDPEASLARLKELRESGFTIALDGFGTGHTSVRTLERFPLDTVKIDRACVGDLAKSSGPSVAQAIIGLAHAFSLKVVAVGVEEPKQLDLLRTHGCDEVQGYLFSRPLPFDAFVEWSGKWETTAASPLMQTVADSLRGPSKER